MPLTKTTNQVATPNNNINTSNPKDSYNIHGMLALRIGMRIRLLDALDERRTLVKDAEGEILRIEPHPDDQQRMEAGLEEKKRDHLPNEIPQRRVGKNGEIRRCTLHEYSQKPMQHFIASRHAAFSLHRATCIRTVRLPRLHCHSNRLAYITCASYHFNRLPRKNDARRCHH